MLRLLSAIFLLLTNKVYAADLPKKVFSAYELQKMSNKMFSAIKKQNTNDDTVSLISGTNPQSNAAKVKQIEQAISADEQLKIEDIYQAVLATSDKSVSSQTISAPTPEIKTETNTITPNVATPPLSNAAAPKTEPKTTLPSSSSKLDAWIQKNSATPNETETTQQ